MDIPAYLLFLFSALIYILGLIAGYFLARWRRRYVGDIEVEKNAEGGKRFSLVLAIDPEELDQHKEVTFHITKDLGS